VSDVSDDDDDGDDGDDDDGDDDGDDGDDDWDVIVRMRIIKNDDDNVRVHSLRCDSNGNR